MLQAPSSYKHLNLLKPTVNKFPIFISNVVATFEFHTEAQVVSIGNAEISITTLQASSKLLCKSTFKKKYEVLQHSFR